MQHHRAGILQGNVLANKQVDPSWILFYFNGVFWGVGEVGQKNCICKTKLSASFSQQIYTEYIRPVENNKFELYNSITKT